MCSHFIFPLHQVSKTKFWRHLLLNTLKWLLFVFIGSFHIVWNAGVKLLIFRASTFVTLKVYFLFQISYIIFQTFEIIFSLDSGLSCIAFPSTRNLSSSSDSYTRISTGWVPFLSISIILDTFPNLAHFSMIITFFSYLFPPLDYVIWGQVLTILGYCYISRAWPNIQYLLINTWVWHISKWVNIWSDLCWNLPFIWITTSLLGRYLIALKSKCSLLFWKLPFVWNIWKYHYKCLHFIYHIVLLLCVSACMRLCDLKSSKKQISIRNKTCKTFIGGNVCEAQRGERTEEGEESLLTTNWPWESVIVNRAS